MTFLIKYGEIRLAITGRCCPRIENVCFKQEEDMRLFLRLLTLAPVLIALAVPAWAADFPKRNFKLIVPYSAGGGTDTMARTLAPELEKALGKKVIIVNRPGAQGQIGMAEIAGVRPDGYTLGLLSTADLLVTEVLVNDAGFTMKSFNYLATFNISANALVVKKGSPFTSYEQFLDFAKNNPGKLTLGVSGHTHVFEIIKQESEAGIDLNFIRFSGGGKSRNALLGGHVDALMIDKRFIPSLSESGAKALAVASPQRFEAVNDVPTFREKNVDLINASRRALVLPLGVPQDRIDVIAKAVDTFAGGADFKAKLAKINEVQDYLRGKEATDALYEQLKAVKKVVDAHRDAFTQ